MKNLFNNIISVQLGASIAIVLLLLSRRTMKKRYVAKLRYWLWLVIALRLCFPLDINMQLGRTAPVNIPVQDYYVTAQGPQAVGQATEFEIITADQLQMTRQSAPQQTITQSRPVKTVALADLLYKFWLVIAALLMAISFISYFLTKREILSTACYDDSLARFMQSLKQQMGISRQVKIAVCRYSGSPMLIGLLHPVIVLPDVDYTATQMEMIVRHELTHLRRNDILYKLILHIVGCVYWFNPLTACMVRLAGKDIEISCDEDIVKTGDKQFRTEYAQTIIRVITMQNNKMILATNFSQNARTVKERFSTIFFSRKLKTGKSILAAFMAVVIMATSMVGCTATGAVYSSGSIGSNVVLNSDIELVNGFDARALSGFGVAVTGLDDNSHPQEGNQWYFTHFADDGKKFVAKIDLNAEMTFLCNKENCLHTDENCLAYISDDMAMSFFTANGNVYATANYASPAIKKVDYFTVTESGYTYLCSVSNNSTPGRLIAGNLIFICIYNEDAGAYGLNYINLATGEISQICSFADFENIFSYRPLDMSGDGEYIYLYAEKHTDSRMSRLVLSVNLKTGEINIIKETDYNDVFGDDGGWRQDFTVEDNMLYTVNLNTDTLTRQGLAPAENTEAILLDGISEKLGGAKNVSCMGVYDNKLIIDITQYNGKKYGHPRPYAIDLTTLEVLPLTNMIAKQSGGITERCNIYGEIGNCFIISTGFNSETEANIGIISCKDFFANKPQVLPLGIIRF